MQVKGISSSEIMIHRKTDHFFITLLFSALLFLPNISIAQDLTPEKIRIYNTADGLPYDRVYCMDQDKNGNLWIGTGQGASRFDGKTFTSYGAKDGFSDESVWAILCDSKGYIWFGTKGDGLFRFDGKKWEQFTEEKDGLSSDNFLNGFLYEDAKGNIWGGRYGIFRYVNRKFKSLFSGTVWGFVENLDNNTYFCISSAYLYKYKKDINKFENIFTISRDIQDIEIDSKRHTLWVASDAFIAKSTDSGKTFTKFQYDPDKTSSGNDCWDMFIDDNNQIWTGNSSYVARFDGSKFHYYNTKSGLPDGHYYYIFQDQQGHLWFGCSGGLAKFDNIPPKLQLTDTIPEIIKTQTLSFRFTGNDGQFGSPSEALIFEYKFADETKWQKAENGQVNLGNLKENTDYRIHLRVTDGFQNSTETDISFRVQLDTDVPTIIITNQDVFSTPLDKTDFTLRFKGQDDFTPPDDLNYRYKLEKKGEIVQDWSKKWVKSLSEVPFTNIRSGEYTFVIQAKDNRGNTGENKVFFTVDAIVDKPKITLHELTGCYFTEQNNRPTLQCDPINPNQEILSGRIKFMVQNIDSRPEKQNLQYAVQLAPIHKSWTTYRANNQYEFNDLSDGKYTLKVRAKDPEEFTSLPQEFTFTVKDFHKLPQTQIRFGHRFGKGKIVGRIPEICWQTDPAKCYPGNCLFSYQLDNGNWTEFLPITCFELHALPTARHTFQVLAKNRHGIEPMPARHEFEYERIHDLPMVRLSKKIPKVIPKNSVTFTFKGQDDMTQGDKTPSEELRYSWRLIPVDSNWSRPSPKKQATYTDLKNGTYFFQVKVVDKSENECVTPAEHYFEIKVIPFYRNPLFYWLVSIIGIMLAALLSVFFTMRRTRQNIYDQRYNPYVVGEAVHDPEMFFGRDILMRDIFQSLKSNSLCLTGERRIGKTTMLEHLEKSASKPLFSFFCNLEGVKEELFFSRIMQHLANKIQANFKDGPTGLNLFEKERETYDDVDFEDDIETVLNWLKMTYDPQVSIIMCLDEIDAIQEFSNETLSILRNIFQTYQGKIRLVAAGVSIHLGNWRLPTSPWYNFFEFSNIEALDSISATKLITDPVKGFYKFDGGAVDFILAKTDNKPFYIQLICKKVISRILDEKRWTVTQNDVAVVYNDLIYLELNSHFETFWEALSTSLRQMILQAVSDETFKVSKAHEVELMNNQYNYGHRAIIIQDEKIGFSTIFKDWLMINFYEL